MPQKVMELYKAAKLKAPKGGKEIFTQKFHEIAVAIKKEHPDYPMSRCYAIAMSNLGKEKAVNKSHQR